MELIAMGFGGFCTSGGEEGWVGGGTHKLRQKSINCGNKRAPFIRMSHILKSFLTSNLTKKYLQKSSVDRT